MELENLLKHYKVKPWNPFVAVKLKPHCQGKECYAFEITAIYNKSNIKTRQAVAFQEAKKLI